MKKKKYKIICLKCKSECEIILEDDGACNDPECCGGASYWIEIKCPKCKIIKKIN